MRNTEKLIRYSIIITTGAVITAGIGLSNIDDNKHQSLHNAFMCIAFLAPSLCVAFCALCSLIKEAQNANAKKLIFMHLLAIFISFVGAAKSLEVSIALLGLTVLSQAVFMVVSLFIEKLRATLLSGIIFLCLECFLLLVLAAAGSGL